jgi:uncharacterized protein (DUF849 family)
MRKVWLEAAVNGPWSREIQPGMPIAPQEIIADGIACVRAGAAIVHVHAYDVTNGRQNDDPGIYQSIIEGIRTEVDAIVYPTIPLAGSPHTPAALSAGERYRAVEELAVKGLVEWAVVDPGSETFARYEAIERDEEGFLYWNPESHIRKGLELAQRFGFHPSYACYEPAFVRLGAALAARFPGLPPPIYRLMFSQHFAFGFPPRRYALKAYLNLLGEVAPGRPWMIAGLGVDIRSLIPMAVSAGGHVRVGLEDAPFPSPLTNVQWIEQAVASVIKAGGEPASATEVRTGIRRLQLPAGDGKANE